MEIIIDATPLTMYPVGRPGSAGGTERYLHELARGLSNRSHLVHVVTPDLERMQRRGDALFYWPPTAHPTHAECVVAFHSLAAVNPRSAYRAPILVCASNGLGADYGPEHAWAKDVDGWPVFSACHGELLSRSLGGLDPERVFVTGLGVDLGDYRTWQSPKVTGRMFFANDPARGLWHALDVFERVRARVPEATLHVGYGFDRTFALRKWGSSALAEQMWECRRRLDATPGVADLGDLDRAAIVREELACQVHAMPSEPPNAGSQIHGITQMECAAAGAALVLSDTEAFPEVFGEAATVLPLPGTFMPALERRYDADDWAEAVVRLMRDRRAWRAASMAARALAKRHSWAAVVDRWAAMLATLEARARAGAQPIEAPEAVA